jgi:alkylation response protein AidB-like acyl-CoA dehydrogenase
MQATAVLFERFTMRFRITEVIRLCAEAGFAIITAPDKYSGTSGRLKRGIFCKAQLLVCRQLAGSSCFRVSGSAIGNTGILGV